MPAQAEPTRTWGLTLKAKANVRVQGTLCCSMGVVQGSEEEVTQREAL